ncbi:MAG: CAP domain-containing protein [Bryobacterales bacterium]|nr:CAP domain-containing protein [Bryobacterales bacterium]
MLSGKTVFVSTALACAAVITGVLIAQERWLGEAPIAPEFGQIPAAVGKNYSLAATGNWYDTANRDQVRQSYLTAIQATANTAIAWTGNQANCIPGDTAQAYKDAVIARVNWFRGMAGVPAGVTLDASLNQQAQQAALIMSANRSLSHTPPSNWNCYTSVGGAAAGKSNLCYLSGYTDVGCITGYMRDDGGSNYMVGHRRWILYPQTTAMGTGDVAQSGTYPYTNALWVIPTTFAARPTTRDTFVAWPPRGYVPYQFIFPRWSFSYPQANFSQATVTVKREGVNLPVTLETQAQGYGENTLVWVVSSPNVGPGNDVRFQVSVNNVQTSQGLQSFQYEAIAMDPSVAGGSTPPPVASAAQAVFLDANGALRLTSYGESTAAATGGGFINTPASARMSNGDIVAVVIDNYGELWLNRFSNGAWIGWTGLGGIFRGNPDIAVGSDDVVTVVARDQWSSYWVRRHNVGTGSGAWVYLGGVFGSDPVVAAGPQGRVFVVGRDPWGGIWSNAYTGTYNGWQRGGGVFRGTPTVVVGGDSTAYIAAKDTWSGVWVSRADINGWLVDWKYQGGITNSDPSIATAGSGTVRLLERDPYGSPFYKDLAEGTLNMVQDWVNAGGLFRDVRLLTIGGESYMTGRDLGNGVWWRRILTGEWSRVTDTITANSPVR